MTKLLAERFTDASRGLYLEYTGADTFWTFMGNGITENIGLLNACYHITQY